MKITITIFSFLILISSSIGQQSFTLEEAVAYGIAHQNAIKMSDMEIENSESDIKELKSIGMPQVNGGIDYNYYFYVPKQPVEDFISPAVYGLSLIHI